jgi:aspartyl-tRNA(Asn)/glutamyl-tRNA(Gln) amidotransferase subunit A
MSAFLTAQRVRAGEQRALEALEESLESISTADGEIHAFTEVHASAAREAAAAIDAAVADGIDPGPLAGVPVAVKDNICQRGRITSCASKILEGWQPPYDATVVRNLIDAGAVIVGTTNMDEFAMGSSTENSAYGPTRNPADTSRVPGGSSGGSAASVAADMVPLSLGSDTGGSIRQPAAFCGVVGVKPTYGLVSRYGLVAFASSLDQIGPFSKDVRDAALLLEVIAGHDPLDSTSLDAPAPRLVEHLDDGVDGLRVGLCRDLIDGASPEISAAITRSAEILAAGGAEIIEISLPELHFGLSAYYLIAPAEASSNLARYDGVRYGLRVDAQDVASMNTATRTAGFGDEVKRRIMLGTYALSAGYYDAYYAQAQRTRTLIIEAFATAYESVDLILGATTPTTAFELGAKVADPMEMYLSDVFTIPTNLAGHPALSLPMGLDAGGLPIGVQLLGPALSEQRLLAAASVLEHGKDGA